MTKQESKRCNNSFKLIFLVATIALMPATPAKKKEIKRAKSTKESEKNTLFKITRRCTKGIETKNAEIAIVITPSLAYKPKTHHSFFQSFPKGANLP